VRRIPIAFLLVASWRLHSTSEREPCQLPLARCPIFQYAELVGDTGNHRGRESTGQQPDKVPMTAQRLRSTGSLVTRYRPARSSMLR
jgi:hypothetical protein